MARSGHSAGECTAGQGAAARRPGRLSRAELRRGADRSFRGAARRRRPGHPEHPTVARRRSPRSSSIPAPCSCSPTPRWSNPALREAGRGHDAARDHHPASGERRERSSWPSPPATTTCWRPAATIPIAYAVVDEDDPISLNYTSGTTGEPKGVVYTHRGAYLNSLGEVDPPGLRRRVQLPVDAADVPLQRLVHHLGADRGGRHPRVPAGRQGRRHLAVDRPRRGHPHGRRADRAVDDEGVIARRTRCGRR